MERAARPYSFPEPTVETVLQKEKPAKDIRRGRLGYMLTDLLVVVACSLAFVAIAGPARAPRLFQGPRAATSLNVPVERLDTVMEKYRQDRLRPQ